jgi:hypothetical protein
MHITTVLRTASSLRLLVAAATALLTPVSVGRAQEGAPGSSVSLPSELEKVRTALDKYRDPIVAVHDGNLSSVGCVEYPKGGGEGPAGWGFIS